MNVLLTGATGFVGKALYQELMARKYNLTCAFRTAHKNRLQKAFEDCTPCFVDHVDKNTLWSPCLKDIDQVVHLAGLAHAVGGKGSGGNSRCFSVNHEGTRNLAVQAAQHGVKRFVFISSILVNGKISTGRSFCETDTENPQNAYAAAKLEAEKSLKKIGANTGMEVVILRPPLVYGPHVKANFRKLLDLVYTGIPLPFRGVSNKRSFLAMENLVDAVCLCIRHEKAANQTFVLSDGEDLSTTQLVEKLAAAMGRQARLFTMPEKFMKTCLFLAGQDHVYDRLWRSLQVDASRIQTLLAWKPLVTVDHGIMATVKWYLADRRNAGKKKAQV
ncbi:MAG: NAD-dependent epimerase/dehydratase family protein [Desulfotignum sp.]|jgi:nucleoside-diphosphate-sugar epimerase|nr:NAD-dependent epimerase/dehydratase family protein [Desulfotignum sp.]